MQKLNKNFYQLLSKHFLFSQLEQKGFYRGAWNANDDDFLFLINVILLHKKNGLNGQYKLFYKNQFIIVAFF